MFKIMLKAPVKETILTLFSLKRNLDSDFLISLSLQPNVMNLRYFKLSGSKNIGIRKFEFVAKTGFVE